MKPSIHIYIFDCVNSYQYAKSTMQAEKIEITECGALKLPSNFSQSEME